MIEQIKTRLITINEVEQLVGFKRDFIYRRIKRGEFPKQIKLGKRSARWQLLDIERWIDQQK